MIASQAQSGIGIAQNNVVNQRHTLAAQWIVLASLSYQAVLCVIHTHIAPISTAVVMASECVIFIACVSVLASRCSIAFLALLTAAFAYLLVFSIFRGHIDPKSFRDILIPLIFFELGRQHADEASADQLLNAVVVLVLACALFELLFLDQFSQVFNVYSYYVSQGNIQPDAGWAKDSVLSLNGIRPEGIGRTILPALLGSHRVSSIFLEPVSLGNFSIVVTCWALSKPTREYKRMLALLAAAVVLIALSDSRYGMLTMGILLLARLLLPRKAEAALFFFPLICIGAMMFIAGYLNHSYTDDFLGRLSLSGHALLDTDLASFFALGGSEINLGDMGYPAMLIHIGFPLCALLWCMFWVVRMQDERGTRMRAYTAIYLSLILCVSGSSMFALKSAGLLWFLLGSRARSDYSGVVKPVARKMQHVQDKSGGRYAH
jgi:putative polymerase